MLVARLIFKTHKMHGDAKKTVQTISLSLISFEISLFSLFTFMVLSQFLSNGTISFSVCMSQFQDNLIQ